MRRKVVSGIILTLLLTGMITLAFNIQLAKASGTIYVSSDYPFTHNVYEPMIVTADNIVIDGNGYTLQGTGDFFGINMDGRSNVTVKELNIKLWHRGIYLYGSSNNSIIGNNITHNHYGFSLVEASNNTISGNNITHNDYGALLDDLSDDNMVFHNNFVDNQNQAYNPLSVNIWDDGYPSGGNYWSDYSTEYPDAEELDGSGIWDTPYVIGISNQDNFPLMEPWAPVEVPPVEDTEAYIDYVDETIQDLPDEIFNRPEEDVSDIKNDLSDLLIDTRENINEDNYEFAIDKLNRIKEKLYEEIAESAERQELISLTDDLIAYLETLL